MDWNLIELSEGLGNASFFDIEDSHDTGFEPTREYWKGWVSGYTERLIDRTGEFDNLVIVVIVDIPKSDRGIVTDSDHVALG